MPWTRTAKLSIVALLLGLFTAGAAAERRDLWIHPRGEKYDPRVHYVDTQGELYYQAENDIHAGLGRVVIHGGPDPSLTAELGPDIWELVERNSGYLKPVIHWDSDGDGRIDRTVVGRLEGHDAHFEGPELRDAPLHEGGEWQLGIVYKAGMAGAPQLDGRYVASITSESARIERTGPQDLAEVGAGPPAGLVILKHREGEPLDFASFVSDPTPFLGEFDELSRAKDGDDWSVKGTKGRLRTHFEREDFFIVRTAGDVKLDVEWGDEPLAEFMEKVLQAPLGADGCYSSLDSRVVGDDGVHRPVPHRILYCPEENVAAFDVPDGYQVFLTASYGSEVLERTEAATSIVDNVQLYAAQVWPRSPRAYATGAVGGTIVAGFVAAGDDVVDMGRHAVTGTERIHPATGQLRKRTSALLAVPTAVYRLAQGKPIQAFGEILVGAFSAVAIAADGVSAVNNAVLNPLVQGTVGLASQKAATGSVHWVGAFSQAAAQNLPFSERSVDAFNPVAAWQHNRAFATSGYTRTDTQLNIDRIMTLANIFAIRAIVLSTGDNGGSSSVALNDGGSGGGGGGGAPTPASPPAPPAVGPPSGPPFGPPFTPPGPPPGITPPGPPTFVPPPFGC